MYKRKDEGKVKVKGEINAKRRKINEKNVPFTYISTIIVCTV
jgi:hypothetical protein